MTILEERFLNVVPSSLREAERQRNEMTEAIRELTAVLREMKAILVHGPGDSDTDD